jgi:pimeloyl-ACP methyl ester carboxylesterase
MSTVMLVHGMFLNPRSWQPWQEFFRRRGYDCIAPAWPLHEGDPGDLRSHVPPGFADLSLDDVVQHMAGIAAGHEDLILVGHSVGGLIVQKLISLGLGKLGVGLCSMAPAGLAAPGEAALRAVSNAVDGRHGGCMDHDTFHEIYANGMHRLDAEAAWHRYVIPGSRRVLLDCVGREGRIDTAAAHVPLLFIGAEDDRITPPRVSESNARAYTDEASRIDHVSFENRGHFIQGQSHWQEVACYVDGWIRDVDTITRQARVAASAPRQVAVTH